MNPADLRQQLTRRHVFERAGLGLGWAALSSLLPTALRATARADDPQHETHQRTHHPAKARNVIFLQMCGGPSQLDLFDPKPILNQRNGELAPDELYKGKTFAFLDRAPKLLGSPFRFQTHGDSGLTVSELLPNIGRLADELCVVRSMHTNEFNHAPAQIFFNTGSSQLGRPSMGSWVTYGLGSAAENLPAFVVLVPGIGIDAGKALWGNGFLPAEYQGAPLRTSGEPVLFVEDPPGVDPHRRRLTIDAINQLNRQRLEVVNDPEIAARIASYELAFRMQSSIPEVVDLHRETRQTLDAYGAEPGADSFANCCLLARRLVESGVRFVQICYKGQTPHGIWDSHGDTEYASLEKGLTYVCSQIDRPAAALLTDLKQRGLLEDTLVVWGGEFGRTCMNENRAGKAAWLGRDHWPEAFTIWMAGGGSKPGTIYGKTDDFSSTIVEDPVHLHDLHATILHLLGVDHTRLTYRSQGRDFRLTDVHGEVKTKLLA